MRRVTKRTLGAVATPCLLIVMHAASASDYGCKVLLCLSNPAGPRAVSECVPPINQLFHDLARGRNFPTCDLANAGDSRGGRSWAQSGASYYDPCPSGMTALPAGALAMQADTPAPPSFRTAFTGIGEGDGLMPGNGETGSPLPNKVCVGNLVGSTSISTGGSEAGSGSDVTVGSYDQVVVMAPQASLNVIDVYVNSALSRRVRW